MKREHRHPPIDSNTAKEMETILNDEEVKSCANYAREKEDDTYFCIQPQVDGTKTTSIGSSGYAGIRQAIKLLVFFLSNNLIRNIKNNRYRFK